MNPKGYRAIKKIGILRRIFGFMFPSGTIRRKAIVCLIKNPTAVFRPRFFFINFKKIFYSKKSYSIWIEKNEPNGIELEKQKKKVFDNNPKISIIVPTFNTDRKFLVEMFESVLNQTYSNWELCIADGDSNKETKQIIETYPAKDTRIKVKFLNENKNIAGNSNEALSLANGEFIALLDHDDTLAPFALYEIVETINKNPDVDFIYSDEDKLTRNGKKRHTPHFKPDFSPDTLRSYNYITHLSVFRKSLIDEIKGFSEGMDGAQDYALILRATEKANKIIHIPKILYHWRENELSTSINPQSKPNATFAALSAIQNHLDRVFGKQKAKVDFDKKLMYCYDTRFYLANPEPLVSIIIPTKDKISLLSNCIGSILSKSGYKNYEIIIMNNKSVFDETYEWFDTFCKNNRNINIVDADYEFNWSKINNHGMRKAKGDIFIFLNNDTQVISNDWIERLAENASRDEVGCVGGLLLFKDNTIQHAGIVVGMTGWAGHVYSGEKIYHSFYPFVSMLVKRNVIAVTGACLCVSRKTIDRIGGFDENFIICGSDVELGIRAYKYGLNNIYDPKVMLYHFESKTRDTFIPECDFQNSKLHYEKFWNDGDPFYNINLSLDDCTPIIML